MPTQKKPSADHVHLQRAVLHIVHHAIHAADDDTADDTADDIGMLLIAEAIKAVGVPVHLLPDGTPDEDLASLAAWVETWFAEHGGVPPLPVLDKDAT
jgi:hypothetical protein